MKYTLRNISYKPHDLDDDIAYFHFDIHFTEPEEMQIENYFYPFDMLLEWLKENKFPFYNYIETTRQSLDAWGPCEVRTMEALGDEAIGQLYDCLRLHLQSSDWIKHAFEHQKKQSAQPLKEQEKTQRRAQKMVNDFSLSEKEMKREQNQYYRFCETVEKQIRQTAIEVYPQIADLPAEKLKEFKHFFVSEIQQMHSNLYKFVHGEEE